MAGIKDYSSTAGGNTSVGGINIQEGMLPSNINNALRALTADIREWYNDSQWVIYGDGDSTFTISYASATSFTVSSVDVTSFYHVGRRIKAVGSSTGTIYGSISASAFSTNTTVTVTWDSGSLSNETLTIYVGALSKTNSSIPDSVIGTTNIAYLASGRCDGVWERNLNYWDIAAGIIIVKEAGGTVTDFKGGDKYIEDRNLLATNSKIDKDLIALLA